jgi:2-oxoglutarate ferredoxin oxidoreductase subunit beta
VHILQRCPTYTDELLLEARNHPDRILLLTHENGVPADPAVAKLYTNQREHDPADLAAARALAGPGERIPIGLFYRNREAPNYEEFTAVGLGTSAGDKLAGLERMLDRFAV